MIKFHKNLLELISLCEIGGVNEAEGLCLNTEETENEAESEEGKI